MQKARSCFAIRSFLLGQSEQKITLLEISAIFAIFAADVACGREEERLACVWGVRRRGEGDLHASGIEATWLHMLKRYEG